MIEMSTNSKLEMPTRRNVYEKLSANLKRKLLKCLQKALINIFQVKMSTKKLLAEMSRIKLLAEMSTKELLVQSK